jgi:flagellin-like hook-associated protein FlgL
MALLMTHNLSSVTASRNLGKILGTLSKSIERLSSGLRINSASDDAAGLLVRELMRADIAAGYQGLRNAGDAISMIQTADGALSVIDEKLIRMKELAEQAATGIYSDDQRELINSEYQAMAAEIDRIANSTNFNGLKLLDGSVSRMNGGRGMTIHFGVGNSEAEDYYFLNIGDTRATSITGLKIGGDAKNDVWGQGGAGGALSGVAGCCAGGYSSVNGDAGFSDGDSLTYGYNWDRGQDYDPGLLTGRYIAGRYEADSGDSLQDLVNRVNAGTQSRVGVELWADGLMEAVYAGGTVAVCFGDEAYIFGDASAAGGLVDVPGNPGPVYSYAAAGSYDGGGFVFNTAAGYGYGLTSSQLRKLEAAGVDLAPLGLENVEVYAAGESVESADEARNQLRTRLAQAFNSLGLGSLEGLSTAAGETAGFTLDAADVTASAYGGVVNGTGLQATIASGRTLKVHTGVYADGNGNWTDDRKVASALQLEEVVLNFSNDGTSRSVATLRTGTTYVSDTYVVSRTGDIAIWGYDAGQINLAGLDLAALGFASASVTGNFRGTGATPAQALSALQARISSAWGLEWSDVDHRLKFSARTVAYTVPQVLRNFDSAAIVTQNDLNGANAARLDASRQIVADQSVRIALDIWKQSGTGVWTSSYAVASELNAMGADFRRIELTVVSDATGANYSLLVNGTPGVAYGSWTGGLAAVDLDDLAAEIADDTAEYLSGFTGGGRLWYAPEKGPTSLFHPTLAEVSNTVKSKVDSGIPDYLTVTASIAGKEVDVSAGQASVLARNTTTLGTVANVAGAALSRALAGAQLSGAAAGLVGMGRIVASAAAPPTGRAPIGQVLDLRESSTLVSGDLLRSAARGSYTYSGYAFSAAGGIGLNAVQLQAFERAGYDLGSLRLAAPSVSASASSTVGSASARQLLLDRLNQLWNQLDFSNFSAFTVVPGAKAGYAPLNSPAVIAGAGTGVLSGNTGATATLHELETLVVHTGVYMDARGNWTDSASIASDMLLPEVTYSVKNTRETWVRMAGRFVSSALVSGDLTMTRNLADRLVTGGLVPPAGFSQASVRVYSSAHTFDEASALLYASGGTAFDALYAGKHYSVEFDALPGNYAAIGYFTAAQLEASATGGNLNGTGAGATVKPGSSLTFHTGIFGSGGGFWTEDRGIASALGFTEIVYEIDNTLGNYTVTMVAPTSWASNIPGSFAAVDFGTLQVDLTDDLRSVIDGLQTGPDPGGHLYRGTVTTPLKPSPDDLKSVRSSLSLSAGDPALKVTFSIEGQELSYLPYGPSPLTTLAHDATVNDIVAALNVNFSSLVAGLQTGAAAEGFGGAGRITRAANVPPTSVIALSDVEGLSVLDVYVPYSPPSEAGTDGVVGSTLRVTMVASAGTSPANSQGVSNFGAWALASAINHNPDSKFWAMVQSFNSRGLPADMVYVFAREGGDLDSLMADEAADVDAASRAGLDSVLFEHVETAAVSQSATGFSLGGRQWAVMSPFQSRAVLGGESWNFTLNGRDAGSERDIWIANEGEVITPALLTGASTGLNRYGFVEIQNAADGEWAGADIRTQSTAQAALGAVDAAILAKDRIRAGLGAVQTRLENTMTHLTIQLESLQAAESRIADVDVAMEMSVFTRANIMAQAATSMLAQANSLGSLALSLIRA